MVIGVLIMTKEESGIIYHGDNINYLLGFKSNYFDCVCIDPPFNSDRAYTTFIDTWKKYSQYDQELNALRLKNESLHMHVKSINNDKSRHFNTAMAYRLLEIHRVLKPYGNLMLICDNKETHNLRCSLDKIFGSKNYINTVTYRRSNRKIGCENKDYHESLNDNVGLIHNYAKNKKYYRFADESIYRPLKKDSNGKVIELDKKFPDTSPDGNPFKKQTISSLGDEWPFHGVIRDWNRTEERMQQDLDEGKMIAHVDGKYVVVQDANHLKEINRNDPNKRFYCMKFPRLINEELCCLFDNLWEDVQEERFATLENGGNTGGKTEELTNRLLGLVPILPEDEQDRPVRVLDCFLGCGTTAWICQKLGFEWVGMDKELSSIDATINRFNDDPKPKNLALDREEEQPWDMEEKEKTLFSVAGINYDPNPKKPELDQEPEPEPELTESKRYDIEILTELKEEHKGRDPANLELWHKIQEESKRINSRDMKDPIRSFPQEITYRLWKKQKYTCESCHRALFLEDVRGDHIIPWSEFGPTTEDNCQVLCEPCNTRKSTLSQREWMVKQRTMGYHIYNREEQSQIIIDTYTRNGYSDIL